MSATITGEDARTVRVPAEPGRFEAARALRHVERLSHPRRVGTPGERRAARYILRSFAASGLAWRRERFAVPLAARGVGVRLVLAAGAATAWLGAWLASSRPLAAVACWVAAGVLVNAPWRLARGIGGRWAGRLTSENLVASRPDGADESAPARVVFLAHYDSKSQVLPTGVRVGLVVTATTLCGLLAAGGVLVATGLPAPARVQALAGVAWTWPAVATGAFAMAGAVVAILAVLAANVTGDRSPGALDNGTGVGTLLELARTWRPGPGAPLEAVWVATGAEEVGLDGAREFARRHADWLAEKPTLVVNLDSVGAGDRVYLAGEAGALGLAGEAAGSLGVPWSRLRVLGAGMDHEPFADRGLAALSVLGDVVGHSLIFHSRRDTVDRVRPESLERAARLAARIARSWAERHRDGWEESEPSGTSARPLALASAV